MSTTTKAPPRVFVSGFCAPGKPLPHDRCSGGHDANPQHSWVPCTCSCHQPSGAETAPEALETVSVEPTVASAPESAFPLSLATARDPVKCDVSDGVLIVEFDQPGVRVELDRQTLREASLIPVAEAHKHCACDTESEYLRGIEQGRNEFRSGALMALEQWHNEHHAGAHRVCYEDPCLRVRNAEALIA